MVLNDMKNFSLTFLFTAAVLLVGCSETKNDKAPTQTPISIHGEGFANITSSNFHAKYVQSKKYDIQTCKQCHGGDFSGGTANVSCITCHYKPGGPENCMTCHGRVNAAPPKDLSDNVSPTVRGVGAHQKHLLGGIIGAPVACTECHQVPKNLLDAGHIDSVLRAEARFDSTSKFFKANAIYNASNVSCNNTYCHGNFTNGNLNVTMTWTDTTSAVTQCGTCHGDATKTDSEDKARPKSISQGGTHPDKLINGNVWKCVQCHSSVVDANLIIKNVSKHINGTIDFN